MLSAPFYFLAVPSPFPLTDELCCVNQISALQLLFPFDYDSPFCLIERQFIKFCSRLNLIRCISSGSILCLPQLNIKPFTK
jgi:hypothetical protein